MTLPPLLLFTDRSQLPTGRDLPEAVTRCAEAGLEMVVLRELDLPEDERADLAAVLAGQVRVVASRRPLPPASGIHLSAAQDGTDARGHVVRGRSCHDLVDVRRAVAEDTDYVTLSPVAPTASKPGYGPAVGADGLRRAAAVVGPAALYALGGITPGNAAAMREAGADGVAVMGAVMRAADPAAVVTRLLQEVR